MPDTPGTGVPFLAFAGEDYHPFGGAHDTISSGPDRDHVEAVLLDYCRDVLLVHSPAQPEYQIRRGDFMVTSDPPVVLSTGERRKWSQVDPDEMIVVPAKPARIQFSGWGHVATIVGDGESAELTIVSHVECRDGDLRIVRVGDDELALHRAAVRAGPRD